MGTDPLRKRILWGFVSSVLLLTLAFSGCIAGEQVEDSPAGSQGEEAEYLIREWDETVEDQVTVSQFIMGRPFVNVGSTGDRQLGEPSWGFDRPRHVAYANLEIEWEGETLGVSEELRFFIGPRSQPMNETIGTSPLALSVTNETWTSGRLTAVLHAPESDLVNIHAELEIKLRVTFVEKIPQEDEGLHDRGSNYGR